MYVQSVINTTNVNDIVDGRCPFQYAAARGEIAICKYFISQGFDPSICPYKNFLTGACFWGFFDFAKIMLEAFPHVIHERDHAGENALHDVCRHIFSGRTDHPEQDLFQFGSLLISAGVDLEACSYNKLTPLGMIMGQCYYKFRNVQFRAIRFLLYHGAKLSNVDLSRVSSEIVIFAQQYIQNEKSTCGWLLTCRHSSHIKRIIGKDMIRLVAEEIFKMNSNF